ncbi:MAG: sigma-54-dependent Fis family transcriptional regulator [Planctomycetaceae bacterium]|nr:sigma-54-dependent Fis family transcriptional regulator [Planctomycetaceae bacterium]
MPRILVIDDEDLILKSFGFAFPSPEYQLLSAMTGQEAVELFQTSAPDVVVCDIKLPDMTGLDLFQKLHSLDPKIPVILMTGHGTASTAIDAMRAGAFEYVLKPLDPDTLIPLVESAAETSRLMRVPAHLPSGGDDAEASGDILIGQCPAMQEVYRAIGRVAPQNVTVLIRGESGTGKEVVARAIYNYSQRSDKPFLAINCAAIPEQLLESELFGHERGSFTGADRKRIGKFEQCHNGTLFMDEIGDMTPLMQTKVLRVLQDQQFERVGGNENIRTDVRLIAATNRDLETMIARRDFRSDLFYRLNVYTINLPPLRERGDDIRLLAERFCKVFSKELGKKITHISPEAIKVLQRYHWPGNVRELQSVIKRAILEATGPVLVPVFLSETILNPEQQETYSTGERKPVASSTAERAHASDEPASHDQEASDSLTDWDAVVSELLKSGSETIYDETLKLMERHVICRVLRHTQGNQLQAARLLGLSRATLRVKCRHLGITIETVVGES